MRSRIFQRIWVAVIVVLTAFCTGLAFVFARHAIWGYAGATGEPEGIMLARIAAGIVSSVFTVLALTSIFMLVRSIRRLSHDKHT